MTLHQVVMFRIDNSFSPLFIGETVVTNVSWIAVFETFSPLFIGETVVTLSPNSRLSLQPFAFSPLFIGETVVTFDYSRMKVKVSPISGAASYPAFNVFQSPFHRGNGCNSRECDWRYQCICFQSPFHRGNGCNPSGTQVLDSIESRTFSPLFIGETVVTTYRAYYGVNTGFQSPFHRGNGCNSTNHCVWHPLINAFQSPFHRGNGCNSLHCHPVRNLRCRKLSVPFSSGKRL